MTAIVPYIVLIILLIWNAQLEGAWLGVKFYLIPEWSKLGSAKVRISQHGFYYLGTYQGCQIKSSVFDSM